jgi:ribose transport system permease protein
VSAGLSYPDPSTAPAADTAAPSRKPTLSHVPPSRGRRLVNGLSFRKIGAVYVWIAITIFFCFYVSETFPTVDTAKQILNSNAITALMALSIIIPLCTRTFDLSIAYVASLSAVTSAYMVAHGVSVVPAVVIALGAASAVGVVNAFVVVGMRVDSFIATLATGSLIQSFIVLMTDGIPIADIRLAGSFADVGQTSIRGITLPVFYTLVVAIVIWFVLEHTATGRRLYATGFNADSARLAGVKTARLRFVSLVVSASIAGVAGIMIASTVGSGDPNAGVPYLLTAYAAAFLGASQIHPGRFNPWGALIAVMLLGTGITGLQLAGAPQWAPSMFTGIVLIAALGITGAERRALTGGFTKRFSRRNVPPSDGTPTPSTTE